MTTSSTASTVLPSSLRRRRTTLVKEVEESLSKSTEKLKILGKTSPLVKVVDRLPSSLLTILKRGRRIWTRRIFHLNFFTFENTFRITFRRMYEDSFLWNCRSLGFRRSYVYASMEYLDYISKLYFCFVVLEFLFQSVFFQLYMYFLFFVFYGF